MDARRENPLCDLEGPRAGMLQGFGIGAGREGKEAGQSPSVLPFGSPPSAAPRGACGSQWCVTGLMIKHRYGVTFHAEGFTQPKGDYSWISSSLFSGSGSLSIIWPRAVTYASVPPVIASLIGPSNGLKVPALGTLP
jgi:hypothetical protein